MSRIGRMPITLPAGVEVAIDGVRVDVKGPKGALSREFFPEIQIVEEDGVLRVMRSSDKPQQRSLHGLTRALLSNMVVGVSKGFEKKLELVGVGYRAAKAGSNLVLTVGYSHPVEMDPGPDLSIEVPAPNRITVSGIDREKVGAFAANIRKVRPPEPYKGKGIKYEGEILKRKAGKAGAK
ncbi:MAG: 50S ribosomal protein L6 [Clostridiales bacterium]|nr:50S ribosomal protein L6 [Clostridiales bacterium]MDR2711733.1 50S ribosomal protein L6 [Clostridiales bacterium]